MKKIPWKKIVFVILILLLAAGTLYARAGGAGGSRGSSGGGDDIIFLIYLIFRLLPFPFNFIAIGVLIILYLRMNRSRKRNSSAFREPPRPREETRSTRSRINIAGFDEPAFLEKAKKAFLEIQQAWASGTIGTARRYISDGIYQRFLTQHKMMSLLQQTNTLEHLKIHQVWIDDREQEGPFDILHVGFRASVSDQFVSKLSSRLNSGGYEEFTEYWTFIRRKEAQGGDLYSSTQCPNCAGDLEGAHRDVAKCAYCGTLLNNGSYDWILSEITQAEDYAMSRNGRRKLERLETKLQESLSQEDFSVQEIEDKASNAYLQIQTALVTGKPELMKRFFSDVFYQKKVQSTPDWVYNRLFLNDVTLIDLNKKDTKERLFISLRSSFQRVRIKEGKKVEIIDPQVISETQVLVFEREQGKREAKGSLYGSACPACGSPILDETAVKCSYCDAVYNAGQFDWIVSDLMTLREYREGGRSRAKAPDILDSLYDVKDYVFNNMMLMIAADGVFAAEEREMAHKIARKFSFHSDSIEPMLQKAAAGKLALRMPNDRKKCRKIYNLMVKIAKADSVITPEEQDLLDRIEAMCA